MSSTRWWFISVVVVAIEIVLLSLLIRQSSTWEVTETIALVTAVVAGVILLILTLRIEDLNKLTVSKGRLEAELSRITQKVESKVQQVGSEIKEKVQDVEQRQEKTEKRQDDTQELIKALSIALEGIVTKYERDHLEKLRPENDDTVKFGPNFFEEIERLDAIGFISPIKESGIIAIQQEHGNPGEVLHLREYVKLTEKGLNYLNVVINVSEEASSI